LDASNGNHTESIGINNCFSCDVLISVSGLRVINAKNNEIIRHAVELFGFFLPSSRYFRYRFHRCATTLRLCILRRPTLIRRVYSKIHRGNCRPVHDTDVQTWGVFPRISAKTIVSTNNKRVRSDTNRRHGVRRALRTHHTTTTKP